MLYHFKLATYVMLNANSLNFWLYRYEVKHKEIVFAQAMLESGYMRCNNCSLSEYNNLFGFQTSEGYIKFSHWSESIKFYSEYQNRYYSGEDYYTFLKNNWGALNMKKYINKLKWVVKSQSSKD